MTADTVTDPSDLPALFEEHRPVLTGVAYRMLGRIADAEDVVRRPGCAGPPQTVRTSARPART